jgi:ubiquinone/menaquinone biosynthesis C-methylase UbiE
MSTSTLIQPLGARDTDDAPARPAMAEWLVAMGPVVHGLDYGGRVAAVGCADAAGVALLATAHPLATLDAVDRDRVAVDAAEDALRRAGASARCTLDVGGAEVLPAGTYDLVCFLHGLVEEPDPVGAVRSALRLVRPTGTLVVVEHSRSDAFDDGPVTVGGWVLRAGAARVRLVAATPHGFVLDARPSL